MPGPTYTIVLSCEQNGRVVRRVSNLSDKAARSIVATLDGTAEIGGAVAKVSEAWRTIERVLSPLTSPPKRLRGRR